MAHKVNRAIVHMSTRTKITWTQAGFCVCMQKHEMFSVQIHPVADTTGSQADVVLVHSPQQTWELTSVSLWWSKSSAFLLFLPWLNMGHFFNILILHHLNAWGWDGMVEASVRQSCSLCPETDLKFSVCFLSGSGEASVLLRGEGKHQVTWNKP